MNPSVDSPAAQKGGIRGIHNCVGGFGRDVRRAVDLNGFAAIEQETDCEGLHVGILEGHSSQWFVEVWRLRSAVRSPRSPWFFYFLAVSASTPGSFFPSRNSSDAPPPVEMCVILSATLAARTAATESPPPTIEVAPAFSATAWAILNVPLANPG